jgi:peptidoglycan/LPS O-acetylase OafA/YrhL
MALGVGVVVLSFGLEAIANGGHRNGMPAFPYFLFGTTCVLAALGDLRLRRTGPPRGSARLTRHLWRMSFALLIAAMSFFLGQADEPPSALRIPALLATPVLAVLVTMLYWVWRVGVRGSLRRVTLAGARPLQSTQAHRSPIPAPMDAERA